MIESYRALALQLRCTAVNDTTTAEEARERIRTGIARAGRQIAASRAFIGQDCRLVVLPEYAFTGHPLGESFPEWIAKAAFAPDGEEEEALGGIAQQQEIYLAVNAYATDEAFDGLYFQVCLLMDPSGDVVLRYRRLNSMFAPTPHDVWSRFLDAYGADAAFPVARTELGAIAAIASEEILYPEIARALALRGAEVFVHPTSEAGSPLVTQKDVARRARAQENLAYVVSANSAGITGSPIPGASTDGGSQVVDPSGAVLVQSGPGESMVANAPIDLAALRRERRRPGMGNLLARQRLELFTDAYAGTVYPPDTLAAGPVTRDHFRRTQEQVIARLAEAGLI
jgi:predicted amidohydrolase